MSEQAAMTTPLRQPDVTVIIPTCNDWPRLAAGLEALRAQTLDRSRYEIVVVDNAKTASNPPALPEGVLYLHWPNGYSYSARNAGVQVARGRVLAFTDSDCLPARDWLEQGLAALDTGVCGGRIDTFSRTGNAAAQYDAHFALRQDLNIRRHRFSVTANLFVTREVFDAVGPFVDNSPSSADREWCLRAHRAGHPVRYASEALVRHPARETLDELLRKSRRLVAGRYPLLRARYGSSFRGWYRIHWRLFWNFRPPLRREMLRILFGLSRERPVPRGRRVGVAAVIIAIHYHTAWRFLLEHLAWTWPRLFGRFSAASAAVVAEGARRAAPVRR